MNRIVFTLFFTVLVNLPTTTAFAHAGHSSPEPWGACDDGQLDDDCQWTNDAHDSYIGTCRGIGDDLMCVRNQPIVRGSIRHGSVTIKHDAQDIHMHSKWFFAGLPFAGFFVFGFMRMRRDD